MLVHAVVVGENRASPNVALDANLGIANISKVRNLAASANLGVLGLDEGADLAVCA